MYEPALAYLPNQKKPYFIILDEMNLSHVERYFADFLSIMESKDTVKLYTGSDRSSTDGLDITQQINKLSERYEK